ncbi:MAG: Ribonuclease Z [bacterium ADurb.Bin236]|nr:MAG: Ribonuclease Z [bacterium ADurb.Bin236]HOY62083.1 MBL fold metallo-hydrolase [bacterium]HPN93743.1 MBL fold metallo-hydrolase [bacterium]
MKIRFWGVRGSAPTPGPKTSRIGGNTSCVEVSAGCGETIIFDAGTGLREMGLNYFTRPAPPKRLHLFLSHFHWDHIQGFPFFGPAFLGDVRMDIYGAPGVEGFLAAQMSAPFFPVSLADMKSEKVFHELNGAAMEFGGCSVIPVPLSHPQSSYGFVLMENGVKAVYSSDTEYVAGGNHETFVEMIRDADILMFDAQYTPEQYNKGRVGWGHSTFEAAAEIVKKAGVKKLVLFHHEPTHDDAAVEEIERRARELFPDTVAAREGMTIEI